MRVLRVTAYFAPAWVYGGPPRSILESCKGLLDLGEEVRVLTTTANGRTELDVPVGVPVDVEGVQTWYWPRRPPRRAFHSPALYRAVRDQIGQFDVVQCHATMLPLGVVVRKAAERARVPYLVTPHGVLDPVVLRRGRLRKALFWRVWERANFAHAAAVVALTEEERRQVLRLAPECRVSVAPNGQPTPDLADVPPRSALQEVSPELSDRPYVLFLGRINWKKGLDLLLPAFARILPSCPEWRLVLAGPDGGGAGAIVDGLVRRLGLGERVLMPGLVDGRLKAALLGNADVFCLPSYSEGLPTSAIEALMLARPVVLSEGCHMPEVRDCGAGWVVETSVDGVAEGLREAMENVEERKARGARGRRLAIERFSRQATAERLRDLYRRCIASRSGGEIDGG